MRAGPASTLIHGACSSNPPRRRRSAPESRATSTLPSPRRSEDPYPSRGSLSEPGRLDCGLDGRGDPRARPGASAAPPAAADDGPHDDKGQGSTPALDRIGGRWRTAPCTSGNSLRESFPGPSVLASGGEELDDASKATDAHGVGLASETPAGDQGCNPGPQLFLHAGPIPAAHLRQFLPKPVAVASSQADVGGHFSTELTGH